MRLKNGKKSYNGRGITYFHETERYVNNLNSYNRSRNGTNLWDDLIYVRTYLRLDVLNYDFETTEIEIPIYCLIKY